MIQGEEVPSSGVCFRLRMVRLRWIEFVDSVGELLRRRKVVGGWDLGDDGSGEELVFFEYKRVDLWAVSLGGQR